ncbi:putative protein kinase RLK-Pelle-DLSV family [Rosa chinensis]|uniref:Protein kinase domain-containing protein n=1 Tax=Rosa chinensis TaxID=74649 RepID=A0A2P6PY48_ROSCH|nr:putative protein kinase RLK-Pelle-DLSV family [Rosa chinensis]
MESFQSCLLKSNFLSFLICTGYMAPDYVMRGHFSVKFDVYNFGVLVLQIVSGERNNSLSRKAMIL